MAEQAETNYQKAKSHLSQLSQDGKILFVERPVVFARKQADYGAISETVDFLVAPNPALGFDAAELNKFAETLKIPNMDAFTGLSGTTYLNLTDGNMLPTFRFGSILYIDPLKKQEDLLSQTAFMEYCRLQGTTPEVDRLHSVRYLHICTYPDWDYAQQILDYQNRLLNGEVIDEKLEFLEYYITQEQVKAWETSHKLADLPQAPKRYNGSYLGR